MLRDTDIDDLVNAVREAAALEILPRFRHLAPEEVRCKSGPTDLVTAADHAAEMRIAGAVSRIWPDAFTIGEETAGQRPELGDAIGSSRRCVIIDPIDGTGNYVAGLTVFGVIVAVVERGETTFGLLYDPVMDDWMFARRGEGAWYASSGGASRQINTRPGRPLEQARGFMPCNGFDGKARALWMRAVAPVLEVQDLRCSCHEYRLLASGQVDFLTALQLHPWDHAAGVLLVQEAGGWARVDGRSHYAPNRSVGTLVAASCADVGESVVRLVSGRE